MHTRFYVFFLILGLTACAANPLVGVTDPLMRLNDRTQFENRPENQGPRQAHSKWWADFNDPILSEMIAIALTNNPDILTAKARIDEARGLSRIAGSSLFPTLDLTGTASRGESATSGGPATVQSIGFDASWELDLFGQNRATAAAARMNEKETAYAYSAAQLSLAAEVARVYTSYRAAQQQLALTRATAKAQGDIRDLVKARVDAELSDSLALAQADSAAQATAALVPVFERDLESLRQSLAVLSGLNDGASAMPHDGLRLPAAIPSAPELPAMTAPAFVLAQRPDIRAAWINLQEQVKLSEAAQAALFPNISLSGLFGIADGSAISGTNIWSVAGDLTQPVLNFGALQGAVDVQNARQVQAFEQYRKAVLGALAEVETSLSSAAASVRETALRDQAVAKARAARDLARQRFDAGISAFTDVLIAEQDVFSAEQSLVAAEAARAQSVIALHKSIGVAP